MVFVEWWGGAVQRSKSIAKELLGGHYREVVNSKIAFGPEPSGRYSYGFAILRKVNTARCVER